MNLKINNEQLIIKDKTYNLFNIDFILNNGKTRIYFKDGTTRTVLNEYTANERLLCFEHISHAVSNKNFIVIKDNILLNLNNIKKLSKTNSGVKLITKGFDLHIIDLTNEQINIINNKIAENKILEEAIVL